MLGLFNHSRSGFGAARLVRPVLNAGCHAGRTRDGESEHWKPVRRTYSSPPVSRSPDSFRATVAGSRQAAHSRAAIVFGPHQSTNEARATWH